MHRRVIPPAFRATGGLEIVTSTLPLSLPSPRAQHPSSYNALARGFEYAQVIAMIDCHVMVMIGIIDSSTLAYKKPETARRPQEDPKKQGDTAVDVASSASVWPDASCCFNPYEHSQSGPLAQGVLDGIHLRGM